MLKIKKMNMKKQDRYIEQKTILFDNISGPHKIKNGIIKM